MTVQTLGQPPANVGPAGCPTRQPMSSMRPVAEISISLPDDLVQRLREASRGDVDAYVTALVQHELDRLRLLSFVAELEEELGPADEAEVAEFTAAFARTAAITRAMEKEAAAFVTQRRYGLPVPLSDQRLHVRVGEAVG